MDAEYNDVATWRYKDLVPAFGGVEGAGSLTYAVRTRAELLRLLEDADFNNDGEAAPGLRFVEVYMPRDDAPAALKLTAAASARNNARMEP